MHRHCLKNHTQACTHTALSYTHTHASLTNLVEDLLSVWLQFCRQLHARQVCLQQQVGLGVGVVKLGVGLLVWKSRCQLKVVPCIEPILPCSQQTRRACMLVNQGPSQQSSKEEYKPWKWGATARYYTSHTKTMLPTRKSMPRSSRQLDHTKISWQS